MPSSFLPAFLLALLIEQRNTHGGIALAPALCKAQLLTLFKLGRSRAVVSKPDRTRGKTKSSLQCWSRILAAVMMH